MNLTEWREFLHENINVNRREAKLERAKIPNNRERLFAYKSYIHEKNTNYGKTKELFFVTTQTT